MGRKIEAKSIIFVYLVHHSLYFPLLIKGTCALMGIPFRDGMVEYCAGNPTILATLELFEDEPVDTSLMNVMTDAEKAKKLDNDLRYLVSEANKTIPVEGGE